MAFTLGSLFDGSGGFPLTAALCGIEPLWASEIEPYPIAVTRSRFPNMKHLGDISKINGAEIPPVTIISFGSPCQDISIAGLRRGIRHTCNGDTETTRSGLFLEAIRIIKEMRGATNGRYPRFAIWENVPGAFSSGTPKGEDFRIVLEEFVKIVEPRATMPPPPKGGWPYADAYVGDGFSVAYRTFDTQYWPWTPQRRRRIYLVADLAGGCASGILFEREGLRGHFAQSESPWKGSSSSFTRGLGTNDQNETIERQQFLFENHAQDSRYNGPLPICPLISAKYGTGGINQPFIVKETPVVSAGFKAGNGSKSRSIGWAEECSPTLTAGNSGTNRSPAVCIMNEDIANVYDARGNGNGHIVNTITGDHENRITDYTSVIIEPLAFAQNQRNEVRDLKGKAGALAAHHGMKQQTYIMERLVLDDQGGSQIGVRTDGKVPTLRAEMHGNIPCVMEEQVSVTSPVIPINDKATRFKGGGPSRNNDGCGNGLGIGESGDPSPTLTAGDRHAVSYLASGKDKFGTLMANAGSKLWLGNQEALSGDYHIIEERPIVYHNVGFAEYSERDVGTIRASGGDCGGGSENLVKCQYIVRRLTPIECARLQGFPDWWGIPDVKGDFNDDEYHFWLSVRNSHAAIAGKRVKEYTKEQMLSWYNKLHSNSSEYKMWGNGIALPPTLYCMQGIREALDREYTLGETVLDYDL